MSAWVTVALTLCALAGTVLVNLIAVSWYFGRKTSTYDSFGPRIANLEITSEKVKTMSRDLIWIRAALKSWGCAAPLNGDD
jgi:hypothetical protein